MSLIEDEIPPERRDEVKGQMIAFVIVVAVVSYRWRENTFSVKLGGRVDLRSADRALVRMCSDIGVFEVAVAVNRELFGTDFEGM